MKQTDVALLPSIADTEVVRLEMADLPRLTCLIVECTDFFELVEGQPGDEAAAAEILGPVGAEYAGGTKHVFGFQRNGELIGVAELLQGYPSAREWFIGLLLLHPEHRREGLGARLCRNILEWIRVEGGIAVRLIVQHQNHAARPFWERQGFSVEREVVSRVGHLSSPVWVLLRQIEEAV